MTRKTSSNPRKRKAPASPEPEDSPKPEVRPDDGNTAEGSPEPEVIGSPWDPTERTIVDIQDLDLDVSYVANVANSRPKLNKARVSTSTGRSKIQTRSVVPSQPKYKRWERQGKKLIDKIEDLPKGWDATEPDLDSNDLDAQIQRCRDRIKENIFPEVFREKLRGFQSSKSHQLQISKNEPAGLSQDVYRRIHSLRIIHKQLKNSNKSEQLSNVEAILDAYLNKRLDWNPGLVTYWSKGVKLCEPRPFSWDEFEAINAAQNHTKSFWTEGIAGPGPQLQLSSITIPEASNAVGVNVYKIALRAPGFQWWDELEFIHDTGSSLMHICRSDLRTILGPSLSATASQIPVIGMHTMRGQEGIVIREIIELEATILNEKRQNITPWRRLQCAVDPVNYVQGVTRRLDGPFLRAMMYTHTVLDGRFGLGISTRQDHVNLRRTVSMNDRHVPLLKLLPVAQGTRLEAAGAPAQPQDDAAKASPVPYSSYYSQTSWV